MQQETLEIKARRYAPVIYTSNGNKIFLPAESYAMGDILITHPNILYEQLKAWQEFRKHPPEDLKTLLFKLATNYFVQTPQKTDGRYQTRKKDLLSLSPTELRFALLRKLFAEKESYNLWRVGGEDAIQRGRRNRKRPYSGKVVLTGNVKAMERGGRGDIPTHYSVNIINPFSLPEGIYCSCEDLRWMDTKEGPVSIDGVCTHAAALQNYAAQNPGLVRNFLNISRLGNRKFFLPFHFRESQHHNLRRYGILIEDLEHLSAQNLDLSHLKIDILVDHLFDGNNYFDIGKKLLLIPHIYNPVLLDAIFAGKAFYEVIIQENVKRDIDLHQLEETKRMLSEMLSQLTSQGYKIQGYALEFKDSPWETICMNYEKDNKIVRILFNEKFPPVFIFRKKTSNDIRNPFLVERYNHPFSYLFARTVSIDDRTKEITSFEVRLPTQITLPQSLRQEYRMAIATHFPGGLDALASRIRERPIPMGNELIVWLRH